MKIAPERKQKLLQFIKNTGLHVENIELVNQSFTHPTYVFENPDKAKESNQRLEFLGDAILGAAVAKHLYLNYPQKAEGELTKIRAALVCEPTLAKKARELKLGPLLLLGKGEEQSGGRNRESNLADSLEALIGALYLQFDINELADYIVSLFKEDLQSLDAGDYGDYKTLIQEFAQEKLGKNVTYFIHNEIGPDHSKEFEAGVYLGDNLLALGKGKSKKEAEQRAACNALKDTWWIENEKR